MSSSYHPESYWTQVADRIDSRQGANVIAGDDEPFYRYKRQQFLKLLHALNYEGKVVLEIGHGPGGNLLEVWKHKPAELLGVDISSRMVEIARKNIPAAIQIQKVDGTTLPFPDHHIDLVFSATVLQHNTDDGMLREIMKEMARVSRDRVVLFERVEKKMKGDELCMGRPVSYYNSIMEKHGFQLASQSFINIRVSYLVCGVIRKLFNPSVRKEGEPLNAFSVFLQKATLPVTRILDKIFVSKTDLARLEYKRQ